MEGSVIAAVCKRLGLDYFTFYYAGDNLDAAEWDERSIQGLTKIDKKKEVMLLALELAKEEISELKTRTNLNTSLFNKIFKL